MMNTLTRRLFNTIGENDIHNDNDNDNDNDNSKEIDVEKVTLLMHKKTFSGRNKASPFKKSHFGESAYLNLIQSPYAAAATLALSHPLTIKKTEFYQPKVITWQEYVDMKTNTNISNSNNNMAPYLHRDSIVAQAKRDYQLRMMAIDGWLSYVNDVTKELENSMNTEHKLRKDALTEIEILEREIQLIEEDPYYNSLLLSHSKEEINQKETTPTQKQSQKETTPAQKQSPITALMHTIAHSKTGVYTGDMIHGYKDGKGRYIYPVDDPSGRKEYSGDWKHDKSHGGGRMIYNCGDVYEGAFKDDMSHGKGKYTWKENGNVYDGNWVNGNMQGHGIFYYSDGDVYEGSFKDDMRDGFGILKSAANGSIYSGEWSQNYRCGKGTLTFQDGLVYEGRFNNNVYIPE